MRNWWVVLVTVACGGPAAPSKPAKTAADYQREFEEKDLKESEAKCQTGVTFSCLHTADHYLEKDPKDPAKAKEILLAACSDVKDGVKDNTPKVACSELFNKKLLTDPDEAAGLCKKLPISCEAVTLAKVLDETQAWRLCTEQLEGCKFIQGQVTTDPEHKQEAAFLGAVYNYSETVTDVTIDQIVNGDDGDDNACHKDTDCKGDRICQAGSCVDAPAKGAKSRPQPAVSKLGVAECDELVDIVVNAHPTCPGGATLVEKLTVWTNYMPLPWKDIPKDRRLAMAPRCKQAGEGVRNILASLCSK